MGQTLFDLLNGKNLVLYPSDELRQQALSTVAIENPRGWRIAKEKASKKIDVIVALAMACCAAMAHRGEIGKRAARGFNRAQHVSKERLKLISGSRYLLARLSSIVRQLSLGKSIVVARSGFSPRLSVKG